MTRAFDPDGPARVRQIADGPTAVMRGEWRDPADLRPNASHLARTITGYRTYCPLRRMMAQRGSAITLQHIMAADMLREQVDVTVIGKGARSMVALSSEFGPITGPPGSAFEQLQASRNACRALMRLDPAGRVMLTEIVLFNHTVHWWCQQDPRRHKDRETGRLLAILDILVDHYAGEIDEALARGSVLSEQ